MRERIEKIVHFLVATKVFFHILFIVTIELLKILKFISLDILSFLFIDNNARTYIHTYI